MISLYKIFFVCYYSPGVSACCTNFIRSYCQHTINYILHIHGMPWIYYYISLILRILMQPYGIGSMIFSIYFFLLIRLAGGIIIIRRANSVDNLRRIVIQNGQSRLINHCPKCRETQSKWQFEENVRKTYRNRMLGFWTLMWHYLWRLASSSHISHIREQQSPRSSATWIPSFIDTKMISNIHSILSNHK